MRDRQEIIGVHRVAAQVMNELARLPIVSAQPSTRTNSSSLNGSEMIVGDSIIMPRLISTVATTRSMTMKGRKMRKPIWNALLSSLVTNAGSATDHDTSAGDAEGPDVAIRANTVPSLVRVCFIMKSCRGATATVRTGERLVG